MRPRRERAFDALVLAALKLAVGAWVLHQGFNHVSDDDYARTVIAEQLAHAPRLDPSGTSWLPFPFWVEGAIMMVAGRSLAVARGVAVALGAASVAAPYLALRTVRVARGTALLATATAMALPWNAWLGVATVPEGWIGALVGAALVTMAEPRARAWAAVALLAASLSRYESWPACAAFAALCLWRGAHGERRETAWAAVALAGPIAWMAWNAHAHGSALHFVARVTRFRHAVGAADIPLADKLLGYPRALLEQTPEVALLGAVGVAGLASSRALRARWRWPAAAVLVVIAFLVWGDARDGAPTHHPVRALAAIWWVLVAMGVDALGAARAAARPTAVRHGAGVAAALATVVWCATLPSRWADAPGRTDAERRDAQIARGLDLRARGVQAVHVTPCAFEHFALLAAWGRPERATIDPPTHAPLTSDCPRLVVER